MDDEEGNNNLAFERRPHSGAPTEWPEISRHARRNITSDGGGSCKAKRRRESATDASKVLFSIDGDAWDSHDDDEDSCDGDGSDQEDYDLEQVKKCIWDAKFRGVARNSHFSE